ncbi:hypothetical protein ACX6VP_004085 [Yersinia enterocolitica]|nr:hypothetical protein [Yersinia enterocolitica]
MIWDENLTTEESHQYALCWISEAFIIHQTAIHRRPVYRHKFGDISLTFIGLRGLIDGYLEQAGKSLFQRGAYYVSLIDWEAKEKSQHGLLFDQGNIPPLTEFGLKWITCQLDQFGDMVQDLGIDKAAQLMGVTIDD